MQTLKEHHFAFQQWQNGKKESNQNGKYSRNNHFDHIYSYFTKEKKSQFFVRIYVCDDNLMADCRYIFKCKDKHQWQDSNW